MPFPFYVCLFDATGFITASQSFNVMALLIYLGIFVTMTMVVVSMLMSVPYQKYLDSRCILMLLIIGTFSAGTNSPISL